MLESEIIVPLIENELADDGHVLVPEMVDGMKFRIQRSAKMVFIIGTAVTSIGIISLSLPSNTHICTKRPPGPNIENLEHMHPILVLERFLPMDFWTKFTQETNAYSCLLYTSPSPRD